MKVQPNIMLANGLFKLKNDSYLNDFRKAGKIAAKSLLMLEKLVKDKTDLSLIEMDNLVEQFIRDNGATPTFKGYDDFPSCCCMSVNLCLVHGSASSYKLQEGDKISFDVGATINGAIADTAISLIYGEPKEQWHSHMIKITKECLDKAIASIKVGKRIGCIGNAIYKHARDNGYNVIEDYGGHCLCIDENNNGILHAKPFIANKASCSEGIRIQPGMTMAIEPMIVRGDNSTYINPKDDAIYTHSIGSHQEHSVFIHEDHVEVITDRDSL